MGLPVSGNLEGLVAPDVFENFGSPCIMPHVVKGLTLVGLEWAEPVRHLGERFAPICLKLGQDPQNSQSKSVWIMPQLDGIPIEGCCVAYKGGPL